jgi:serine/threonine-protein kinase
MTTRWASLAHGACGIGYTLRRLAPDRLAIAADWAARDGDFHGSEGSLLHGRAGVHVLRALIAADRGDDATKTSALAAFLDASHTSSALLELALGKAGLLIGACELVEALGRDEALLARGTELAAELRAAMDAETFATSTTLPLLGLAHGWAGVLFALLRWCEATGADPSVIRAKLDELASLGELTRRGARWPVTNQTVAPAEYFAGWCHGVAGHVLLWALAHEKLGDARYAELAVRAATTASSATVDHGTLCCGLVGLGYAYAAVERITGDPIWGVRARLAAQDAFADTSDDFADDSLWKGAVGAVLFHEELAAGVAAMPLLERRRSAK